jgi:VIT1/CCC1 family predicted Fe2+/Mn2+ transporter
MTADLADITTLQTLMNYSLSDIPDKKERERSLILLKRLFSILHDEVSNSNIFGAVTCGITTFLTGIIPLAAFLILPAPLNIIVSLGIVGAVVGDFLVRYRSRKAGLNWKITLLQTVAVTALAVIASLLLARIG